MPSRLTLMTVLAGALYLGPFLAGLSRQPPWTLAVLSLLLASWGVLYQSGPWPRRIADLRRPGALFMTVLLAGLMLVLAGLLYLAGRGLSVVTGVAPLPLALPLAIPALAILAALLVQSPRKAAEMDAFLDDALRQLQGLLVSPDGSDRTSTAAARSSTLTVV